MPRRSLTLFVAVSICWPLILVGRGLVGGERAGHEVSQSELRAIFKAHCLDCHNTADNSGGLSFESDPREAETDSGKPAIDPDSPENSELLQRIQSQDEDLRMPPDGPRLSGEDIALLTVWIRGGAVWEQSTPARTKQNEEPEHWSFRPVSEPVAPQVNDSSWAYSNLDRFIQARRESAGLMPLGDAAPRTLVRRAYYDLTGLPPTPNQVQEFVQEVESSGDMRGAFSRLVDELLREPSYGQRWGRHWMDWVRYADTAGCNSDFPIPQAYLYRNYIIDAFNQDIPYDRFLTEQLAGDLLPASDQQERNRLNIATGYLAMARRFGSLVETYPWHLTVEDTIDNVGRTMMGLTLSCARCHDHKFDPITTRDYYGLYGIFESTRYPFPGIELFQVQHDMVPLVSDAKAAEILGEHQRKTENLEAALEEELLKCRARELENAQKEPTASVSERRKMHDELQRMLLKARDAGNALAKHLKDRPELPMAYAVQDQQPRNARIQIKGDPTRLGAEVQRKFPELLGGQHLQETESSGRLELAKWITSSDNPLTARVIVNRVWQRHFGQGLVASTSDFGLRGELPSHPELLDWLATDFMRHGWSIKHLHRTIMTSRTYQMASMPLADTEDSEADFGSLAHNLQSDPNNRLHWRFNRTRLDAEEIRDTLLLLSGELDLTPQTEPYAIPPQKEWKYTQHHPFKDDYPSNKRSVYQMTKRLTVQPYMQTFDGPDPNVCTSDRDQSVTALQALFFVNDEFLHQQAKRFATKLWEEVDSEEAWIEAAVNHVLCRPTTAEERQWMLEFLASVRSRLGNSEDARDAAYASLARSLMRLNEFLYVD